MAYFEIPIEKEDDDPAINLRTVLEGTELVLEFFWNTRDSRWNMSVFSGNGVPLIYSHPLNIDMELFERFEIPELPLGKLLLFDMSGKGEEAGIEDLGKRCKLLYETSV